MFGLFDSKTKKLVKKWEHEHEHLVELAGKIINNYAKHDEKQAKKELAELSDLASSHFMDEDLNFYKLTRDGKFDEETVKEVKEFTESFKKVKIDLMSFFANYSRPEVPLDDEFFRHFNDIVEAVGKRIEFEEGNLYKNMVAK